MKLPAFVVRWWRWLASAAGAAFVWTLWTQRDDVAALWGAASELAGRAWAWLAGSYPIERVVIIVAVGLFAVLLLIVVIGIVQRWKNHSGLTGDEREVLKMIAQCRGHDLTRVEMSGWLEGTNAVVDALATDAAISALDQKGLIFAVQPQVGDDRFSLSDAGIRRAAKEFTPEERKCPAVLAQGLADAKSQKLHAWAQSHTPQAVRMKRY